MQTMTGDPVITHPEYARAYLHYIQHGSDQADAGRRAREHAVQQLAATPEYARVHSHYLEHGSSPEDAARLALEHTAQQPVAALAARPTPTSTGKVLLIVAAVILGCFAFVAIAVVIARSSGASSAADDVDITSCSSSGERSFQAELSVTNNTRSSKTYSIKVEYVDSSGDRVGDALVFVTDLAADHSATERVTGYRSDAGTTCKLIDVTRY